MKREFVIYECDRCDAQTDPDEQAWRSANPPNGWMVLRIYDPHLGPDGAVREEGLFCPTCVEAMRNTWRIFSG